MNRAFLLLSVVASVISGVTGTTYQIRSHYVGTTCDGTPYSVTAEESTICSNETTCSNNDDNSSTVTADVVSIECTSDLVTSMRKKFGDSPYILQINFQDETCSIFNIGYGFPASGNCEGSFNETDSYYVIGRLNSNGSTSINYFSANPCLSSSWYNTQSADQATLSSHSCDANRFKWYSSNDAGSTSTSGFTISVSSLIGIGFGLLILVIVGAAFILFRRLKAKRVKRQLKLPQGPTEMNLNQVVLHGQSGLWDDDVITTKRIPRGKVVTRKLLSRGAYGEVYAGSFNSRQVAVKMLLSATRGNIEYVNEFLAEAKMTASLDHPHVVSFVGVAWDSLSDLCVVLEFMEGGDLRTLLNTYQASHHPVGLNRQMISIALNLCEALTYLHSFLPPIIHRDLKSRNVLLDSQLNAKLSDFGISRERLDRTMTACVGTSLWMAPEVMLGERYDVKADMFSFGVVLSELDVHTMPYARVLKENVDPNGREMAGVTLFQKVALGTVQVEFSDASPKSVVALGRACMKVDPSERPSAAEAMYKLQVILASLNLERGQLDESRMVHYRISSPNTGHIAIISQRDKTFMLLQTFTLLVVAGQLVESQTYAIFSSYLGDECDGTPYLISVAQDDNCIASSCSEYRLFDSSTVSANMVTTECSTDYLQSIRDKFGHSPYLIQVMYADEHCSKFSMAFGYPATGSCVGAYNESESLYVIARLNENGSASFKEYVSRSCISEELYTAQDISTDTIASHLCDNQWLRWYSSNDIDVTSGSGSMKNEECGRNISSIIGIALSSLILFAIFAVVVIYMRRVNLQLVKSTRSSKSAVGLEVAIRGQSGLWNDDIITARRIPRDKVLIDTLLSRGAFGEVYKGTFNGQRVAIKMLLPANREKLHRVNEFLAEAKMTATMDHPHIVSFIGVAWDSLSDLCVALEFMNGGELRTMLDKYEEEKHPVGFNRLKTTIALQVCHALTYLHSFLPSVIHRDLKSRNILLDGEMKAKLSDFGISRAQLDRTMTAGVGTSLWMAPEVLLGERYDNKVDMFSFGVVLSELDLHTRPYARVRQENLDSNGREMTESVLLEKVALGRVQVEFSMSSSKAMVELGRACVSIDPTQRPSAAEALYRLHIILSRKTLR